MVTLSEILVASTFLERWLLSRFGLSGWASQAAIIGIAAAIGYVVYAVRAAIGEPTQSTVDA
jgi:hypothetical protein